MNYLSFELSGDLALWRNPYESMGSFSCLGPAPSNIAGLLGAALNFAAPRSQAYEDENGSKELQALAKNGLPWPISPQLLKWEEENDFHVACRWLGGFPRRIPWNVNGLKEFRHGENLRIQQQVIENPKYQIVIHLAEGVEIVAAALKNPAFPLYLGASFCRAIIGRIEPLEKFPSSNNWAQRKSTAIGEATPLSKHVVNAGQRGVVKRIVSDDYWMYPTPAFAGERQNEPMIKGYCRL